MGPEKMGPEQNRQGTGLTPLSHSPEHQVGRGQSRLPGIPGPSWDIASYPTTGSATWSVLFDRRDDGASPVYLVIPGPVYVVHGPIMALVVRKFGWGMSFTSCRFC